MAKDGFWDVLTANGFERVGASYQLDFNGGRNQLTFEKKVFDGWWLALYERMGDHWSLMLETKIGLNDMPQPRTAAGLCEAVAFMTRED